MPEIPFFSVIIPTYNRERDLDRALQALAAQTFLDFEVIVCDDGSTDGTREVCARWSAVLNLCYLYAENWGGPARPRNNGLRRARGEWVCFLDSDDWWYPSKLERIRAVVADTDVVYHACHAYSGSGAAGKKVHGRTLRSPVFEDLMVGWNPLVTSATCVRRSVLDRCGGFAEDRALVAVEDFDLWLRIARVTERFRYLPEVLGVYALAGGNLSGYSEASASRESAVCERHVHHLERRSQKLAARMLSYRKGLLYWHLGQGRKSRECFVKALFPSRWRHRLLVVPWIVATFLRRER